MSLRTAKQSPRIFADTSLRGKIGRWWLAKSDAEQRTFVTRSALVSTFAAGLVVALPMISSINVRSRPRPSIAPRQNALQPCRMPAKRSAQIRRLQN